MIWFFIALALILAAVLILCLGLCRVSSDADDLVEQYRREGQM